MINFGLGEIRIDGPDEGEPRRDLPEHVDSAGAGDIGAIIFLSGDLPVRTHVDARTLIDVAEHLDHPRVRDRSDANVAIGGLPTDRLVVAADVAFEVDAPVKIVRIDRDRPERHHELRGPAFIVDRRASIPLPVPVVVGSSVDQSGVGSGAVGVDPEDVAGAEISLGIEDHHDVVVPVDRPASDHHPRDDLGRLVVEAANAHVEIPRIAHQPNLGPLGRQRPLVGINLPPGIREQRPVLPDFLEHSIDLGRLGHPEHPRRRHRLQAFAIQDRRRLVVAFGHRIHRLGRGHRTTGEDGRDHETDRRPAEMEFRDQRGEFHE